MCGIVGYVGPQDALDVVLEGLRRLEYRGCDSAGEALRPGPRRLRGASTLVATHAEEPDTLVGSRRNSPLVVGTGDGEYFLGSDVAAFIAHTRNALELGQDQVVEIDRNRGVTVTDFAGNRVEPKAYTVDWDAAAAEKGGYDWFMPKEIA